MFWHPFLGTPPAALVAELSGGSADGYHAGLALGTTGQPDDIDLLYPGWYFAVDPLPDRQAMSWRVTLDAFLVRSAALAALGGIDPVYEDHHMAGLDLGWRLMRGGSITVHEPRLVADGGSEAMPPSAVERYLFLLRHWPNKWVRYVAVRRSLAALSPVQEAGALRRARHRVRQHASPRPPEALYQRPLETAPAVRRRVSVVIPTLGRYELLRKVLCDLRAQTLPLHEIICVDQNGDERELSVYDEFTDLPLQVIAQDRLGQWLARNTALEAATGDLLLFLDDDSHVESDFVTSHLKALDGYCADISAGASLSVVGAPVPADYGYYRAGDQFDSGNALVRRDLLARVGGFDQQYDRMRSGDAEFGLRAYNAGAVLVHNPEAFRIHFKAAAGGLRSFGSWDSFRQRGWLSPLPMPSVVYFLLTNFSRRQAREALLIGLTASVIPFELKRTASPRQWLRHGAVGIAVAPITLVRLFRSVRQARRMVAQGPQIPEVAP
jgi:GT2 family glycosyltransferase